MKLFGEVSGEGEVRRSLNVETHFGIGDSEREREGVGVRGHFWKSNCPRLTRLLALLF